MLDPSRSSVRRGGVSRFVVLSRRKPSGDAPQVAAHRPALATGGKPRHTAAMTPDFSRSFPDFQPLVPGRAFAAWLVENERSDGWPGYRSGFIGCAGLVLGLGTWTLVQATVSHLSC